MLLVARWGCRSPWARWWSCRSCSSSGSWPRPDTRHAWAAWGAGRRHRSRSLPGFGSAWREVSRTCRCPWPPSRLEKERKQLYLFLNFHGIGVHNFTIILLVGARTCRNIGASPTSGEEATAERLITQTLSMKKSTVGHILLPKRRIRRIGLCCRLLLLVFSTSNKYRPLVSVLARK